MSGKLENKVAIITAGGSGIGAATARRFVQEGASIVVADISGRRAEEVASAISARRVESGVRPEGKPVATEAAPISPM